MINIVTFGDVVRVFFIGYGLGIATCVIGLITLVWYADRRKDKK